MDQIGLLLVGAVIGAFAGKATEWILEALKRSREPKIPNLVKIDEVSAWGWSGERLLRELIRLDQRVLGMEYATPAREGTAEQWAPLFVRDADGWAALAIGKKIVGYFSFFALNSAAFQKAKCGKLLDSEVSVETTVPLDTPGFYEGYLVLLAALPGYPRVGPRLLSVMFDHLRLLADRGVLFSEILANAYTPDGNRLCQSFGMTRVCDHEDFGVVYSLKLNPWPARLDYKQWADLKRLYEERMPVTK